MIEIKKSYLLRGSQPSKEGSLGSLIGPMSYTENTPLKSQLSPFINPRPVLGGGQ